MRAYCYLCVVVCAACAGEPAIEQSSLPAGTSSPSPADCGDEEDACVVDTSYDPLIDPARFVDDVDNPLFPLVPGTTFVYENGDEHIEVAVTDDRKTILGVSTVVVHDVASVDGEVIEDTLDWYAQDVDGAVWYFGEDTKAFDGDVVSTEGSWEAGVDGAKPGVILPASPERGMTYRQEYAACEAEDMGEIVNTCASALGHQNCLQTLDTTPLDPASRENKYYCPGIGLVLSIDLVTGDREELVEKR